MITELSNAEPIEGVPSSINQAVSFHPNTEYGDGERDVIDVYKPNSVSGPTPCLLFFHGGSFVSGKKENIRRPSFQGFVLDMLSNGVTVISANYELTQVPYDPQGIARAMRAAAKAIEEIKKAAEVLGIDPDNIIFMGSSAGGFISQWFSMVDFGVNGVSLLPKAAISFKPNLTMNLFRIEELGLLGEGRTIDDALEDKKFAQRCISWFALQPPNGDPNWVPTERADLNQESSILIQWRLDPIGNNMFRSTNKPLLLISDNPDEEPDEIEEYIHNPANVQQLIDRYVAAGAPIFALGLNANNPTPNFPEDNPPDPVQWALAMFNA